MSFCVTAILNTVPNCTRSSHRCRARPRPTRAAPWPREPRPSPRRSPPRKSDATAHRTHDFCQSDVIYFYTRTFTFVQSYKLEHRACAEQNTQTVTNFFIIIPNLRILSSRFVCRVNVAHFSYTLHLLEKANGIKKKNKKMIK